MSYNGHLSSLDIVTLTHTPCTSTQLSDVKTQTHSSLLNKSLHAIRPVRHWHSPSIHFNVSLQLWQSLMTATHNPRQKCCDTNQVLLPPSPPPHTSNVGNQVILSLLKKKPRYFPTLIRGMGDMWDSSSVPIYTSITFGWDWSCLPFVFKHLVKHYRADKLTRSLKGLTL